MAAVTASTVKRPGRAGPGLYLRFITSPRSSPGNCQGNSWQTADERCQDGTAPDAIMPTLDRMRMLATSMSASPQRPTLTGTAFSSRSALLPGSAPDQGDVAQQCARTDL